MSTALKNEELARFRQMLLQIQARLRGDVEQLADEALSTNGRDAASKLSNTPVHMADVGSENFEQEFTLGILETEQVTLSQVNEALGRLDHGTFGTCLACGQPIPRNRLEAIPYAELCIACARKRERPA
jgi:RNA polymerase-binding protein DksA